MTLESMLALLVSAIILVYLLYTLLRPERF